MSNSFDVLNNIDVSGMTKKKGQFDYLPWATAVREASKKFPKMQWDFTSWEGLPYLQTPTGFYVECTVVIDDVKRTQMMPVLNHKNQTDMKPNAMAINKSQMRALTKAIALHGLGIDLWAGEDLVDDVKSSLVSDEGVEWMQSNLWCSEADNFTPKAIKVMTAVMGKKFKGLTGFDMVSDSELKKIKELYNAGN